MLGGVGSDLLLQFSTAHFSLLNPILFTAAAAPLPRLLCFFHAFPLQTRTHVHSHSSVLAFTEYPPPAPAPFQPQRIVIMGIEYSCQDFRWVKFSPRVFSSCRRRFFLAAVSPPHCFCCPLHPFAMPCSRGLIIFDICLGLCGMSIVALCAFLSILFLRIINQGSWK